MAQSESWHLDKKVPLGIIIALFIQTVVITSWGTAKFENFNNRIETLEKTDKTNESHENRITILEQQWSYIREGLAEIKALLRQERVNKTGAGQ